MRRGTTPTITVKVKADLSEMNINLALNAGALIVKSGDDLTISVDHGITTVSTTLTQEDTLSMTSGQNCKVQIRAYNNDGSIAIATDIGSISVDDILEEGVLPHEEPIESQ